MVPKLYLVVPCYNEWAVLPFTLPMFVNKLEECISDGRIDEDSKVLCVDDGSTDRTWSLICEYNEKPEYNGRIIGIRQSRNRGHQNAILAGMMEAKDKCDVVITVDADGQDDINAVDDMIECYVNDGCDIVYGVRSNRRSDTWFKRTTAQSYYKFLRMLGADVVYNHADYRLVSSKVLNEFENFHEVNLFLRGMFPLVGFKSTSVYYVRHERLAGKSHYPLKKMIRLAFDGITSLSTKPLGLIMSLGILVAFLSFIGILWALIAGFSGQAVPGWTSTVCIVCFMGGIQLICLGVLGIYVGKTYMEVKHRPRYIISERVGEEEGE